MALVPGDGTLGLSPEEGTDAGTNSPPSLTLLVRLRVLVRRIRSYGFLCGGPCGASPSWAIIPI